MCAYKIHVYVYSVVSPTSPPTFTLVFNSRFQSPLKLIRMEGKQKQQIIYTNSFLPVLSCGSYRVGQTIDHNFKYVGMK